MFKIFDRYLVREILLPFVLALVVATFILLMPPIMDTAQQLIEKGVEAGTIVRILVTLLPQSLCVTIPMALLYGILMGLGRLSADREFVALQACGVSVFRTLRPIAVLALAAFAADQYMMLVALPNANQTFREITFNVVASKAESDVKPRTFYEGFPNRVIYVRDVVPGGGWRDVFLADNTRTDQTTVFFASRGRLLIDREKRSVQLVLETGTSHTTYTARPDSYTPSSFEQLIVNLDADAVFKRTTVLKGDNERTIAELRALAAENRSHGQPDTNQRFTIQQKFSIPMSCLVLAAIGLALGASNRKDGTLASFALGSGVIFIYYVLLYLGRAAANGGRLSPTLAPWVVNIVLGLAGAALVFWRAGASGEAVRIPIPRWLSREAREAARPDGTPSGGSARNRVVVVVRIPQIEWPRPTLLDLYVARQYLTVFLLAFVSLISIFYIATFIDLADKLFRGSTTTLMLVRYFYFQTPQYIYFILPLAALLSTLVTLGVMTKNSEMIVMRACGISLYRSAMPLVLFAVVLSAALFGLQEYVLADSNREAGRLNAVIRQFPTQTFGTLNRRWIIGQNGDIYHYEQFDPSRNRFDRMSIFTPDPASWSLKAMTFAGDVTYSRQGAERVWIAHRGWDRQFGFKRPRKGPIVPAVSYTPFDERPMAIETPSYFKADEPEADRMTFGELQRYIERMQSAGYRVVSYQVQLQRKVAFPVVTLIMTLLAVPFAVTTGRSGALYGIGIGISLAIVYWTAQSVFGAMGAAGLFPPLLAAWAPNILFGAAAGYMLLTVRT